MLIGVDFDNTIVCYDELFHRVALERSLIPSTLSASKTAVREHLRKAGQEHLWTELQGYVYGPRMDEAQPFPGVVSFFTRCRQTGTPVRIISHRTRYPYRGERYDLHQSARNWLATHGFHEPAGIGLDVQNVWLEATQQDKLARIDATGCTHFIDDLPEFLADPGFPGKVTKVLFDPKNECNEKLSAHRVASWAAIEQWFFAGEGNPC